jgi:hypothetical protein
MKEHARHMHSAEMCPTRKCVLYVWNVLAQHQMQINSQQVRLLRLPNGAPSTAVCIFD